MELCRLINPAVACHRTLPYVDTFIPAQTQATIGQSLAISAMVGAIAVSSIGIGYLLQGRQKLLVDVTKYNKHFLVKSLLKFELDPYCVISNKDGSSTTAIHEAVKNHALELLTLFLSKNGDIDKQDSEGSTPLHIAAMSDDEQAAADVQFLIEHGACIQATDIVGNSPLHVAVQSHAHSSTEALLKLQADVNAQDFLGNTPLHDAALAGNLYGITLLLQHGARPDILSDSHLSAYDIAIQNGHNDAAGILVNEQTQRRYILALDSSIPKNVLLDRISPYGSTVLEKLFNREIGK